MNKVSEDLLNAHAKLRTTRAIVRMQINMRREEREAERREAQSARLDEIIIEFRRRKNSFKERYSKWQK